MVKLTEGVNILQARESIENSLELFTEGLLSIFDLTSVETCRGKFSISDVALSIAAISLFFLCKRPPLFKQRKGLNSGRDI